MADFTIEPPDPAAAPAAPSLTVEPPAKPARAPKAPAFTIEAPAAPKAAGKPPGPAAAPRPGDLDLPQPEDKPAGFLQRMVKGVKDYLAQPSPMDELAAISKKYTRPDGTLDFPAYIKDPERKQVVQGIGLGFAGGNIAKVGAAPAVKAAQAATKPVADTIEKIFSPTTVSDTSREAEALIRGEIGPAERATAQAKTELDGFAKQVNALPPADQLDFISYVEGRSKGVALKDPALQPVADSLKKIYEERRAKLSNLDSTQAMSFVEDYYQHMWKNKPGTPDAAQDAIRPTKQGSGRNLKERSIPTVADGLAAGLEPVTTNPLEQTMLYVTNMDRFIANNSIIDKARASGTVKYYIPGKQPDGWAEIDGRLAQKTIPTAGKEGAGGAMPMRAYAPADFARVYNNFISRGFHAYENAGLVYDKLLKASNSITMSELGLSGYHAYTMAQEAMIDGFARALGKGARGDIAGIAKETGKSPFAPGLMYQTGKKFEQQYLGTADHGPDFRKIVDLATKANVRAQSSRAQYYRGSAQGSFWDAWKKGSLKTEMLAAGKDIAGSPVMGSARQFAKTWARTMDTVSQPIFDKMVPRLKNGAVYENLQDWLQAHPTASAAEQEAAARQIVDTVDNRFGELNMDNIFWNKMLKQSLQLMVRAVGWDLGTLREIGGGVADLARGQTLRDLSPRTKYILALPVVTALGNATWQYLKTGKAPDDPWTYQTGGTVPGNARRPEAPERAMVPGYMKDVLGYLSDPVAEAGNKIATGPKLVWELLTNKDYRGLPIAETSDWAKRNGAPSWMEAYGKQIMEAYVPLSVKQQFQRKKGSGLSVPEQVLGIRPAPMYLQNPKAYGDMMEGVRKRADQAKERSDKSIARNLEGDE